MKYAIISDIHGNLEALETVLAHAREQKCEKFVCGGDVVGYNANPSECIRKIREMAMPCVKGNHDEYIGVDCDLSAFNQYAAEAVVWARKQLSEEERKWLSALRYIRLADNFSIVHSTWDSPKNWGYVQTEFDAHSSFFYQPTSVSFHGHTHVPLAFVMSPKSSNPEDAAAGKVTGGFYDTITVEKGKKYFVNVGSVGQPRDGDPRAAYATYDTAAGLIELHRLDYDIAATQAKIRAAGLPERLAERLEVGK